MLNNDGLKVKPMIWRQEINVFNNKVMMETTGTHKNWMVKIYSSYKTLKHIRPSFIVMRTPNLIKLFILGELAVYTYSNFIKKHDVMFKKEIVTNPVYNFFKKDRFADYLVNCVIYTTLGNFLYLRNKTTFYSVFLIGSLLSIPFEKVNNKILLFFEEKLKIEDFQIYQSVNIVPKMLISLSILQYLNFFLSNNKFRVFDSLKIDKKAIFTFLIIYSISKITQICSHFTTESIK
jgi:hypothetical protein